MTTFKKDLAHLGRDLGLEFRSTAGAFEDADLVVAEPVTRNPRNRRRDLAVVTEVEAATQLLVNRLKTQKGELTSLGHPGYGSRHHELVGEPNIERTRSLIKLHVLEALRHEPRIEEILSCDVTAAHEPPRDIVRIVIDVSIIDAPEPLNLVVPFSLGVVE